MANYVNVIFLNDTLDQHVYTIRDDTLKQVIFDNQPLAGGESVTLALVADVDGHGDATYGYIGQPTTSVTDLNNGDTVRMN